MKATVQHGYGTTDLLGPRTSTGPGPGEGEILLSVPAAGLDRGVEHLLSGRPYLARLTPYATLRSPKDPAPGSDVAGRVEVVGRPRGQVRADACQPPHEQPAADPISGLTALQGLRDSADVRSGQHVLVIGAAGGVGSYGAARQGLRCRGHGCVQYRLSVTWAQGGTGARS